MKPFYGGFATQEELDREYDAQRSVPDFGACVRHFLDSSAAARAALPHEANVPYGPTKAENANVFPAAVPGSPVLVFVHGGYWRSLAANVFDMVATGPVAVGWAVVNVNYALCPAVTITEIVRQVRAALAWTYRHAASFNGDPGRIFIAGHSAGGHLAGMAALTEWEDEYGLPGTLIKGGLPVSGLFDLRPFPASYLQPQLRLSAEEVDRNSPVFHVRAVPMPLVVAWGAAESGSFRKQSLDFLAAWQAAGNAGEALPVEDAHHFNVLDGFITADGLMTRTLDAMRWRVEGGAWFLAFTTSRTADGPTAAFLARWCPGTPVTRGRAGHEAPPSSRKVRDALGFTERQNWRGEGRALGTPRAWSCWARGQ